MKSFGDALKTYRADKDMTQEELSIKSGVSRSYIASIESNMKNPSLKTTEKFNANLKVDISLMIDGWIILDRWNKGRN